MRSSGGRPWCALFAFSTLISLALAPSATAARAAPVPAAMPGMLPVPALHWRPCTGPGQSGFQCATAKVPFDYGNPLGAAIHLSVIRHPAADPRHRIGTLFFNPGGPGGSGVDELPAWLSLFPKALRDDFDLVSWDPRGVGQSDPVQCFATPAAGIKFFASLPQGFPVGAREDRAWLARYAQFGRLCAERNGTLLDHVSTADTARDLDLLRQAVGESRLNYLGVSYGTFLGATYANMFPNRVRAVVLDGNINPVSYTNGGNPDAGLTSTSTRIGTPDGSAAVLAQFLKLCARAGVAKCAFASRS